MAENPDNKESERPKRPLKRTLYEEEQRHKKRTLREMEAQVASEDRLKYHVPRDPTKKSKKVEQNLETLQETPEEKRKNIERVVGIGQRLETPENRAKRLRRLNEAVRKIKKKENQED